mmetsp:Transcript_29241/g.55406  ORF Transcript_29241/g.55406 Transcript_29241/m.55406 type:complete len:154 (-) Transcript_29241:182-643(-)
MSSCCDIFVLPTLVGLSELISVDSFFSADSAVDSSFSVFVALHFEGTGEGVLRVRPLLFLGFDSLLVNFLADDTEGIFLSLPDRTLRGVILGTGVTEYFLVSGVPGTPRAPSPPLAGGPQIILTLAFGMMNDVLTPNDYFYCCDVAGEIAFLS